MSELLLGKIADGDFDTPQLFRIIANAQRTDNAEVEQAARSALQQFDQRAYTKRYITPVKKKVQEMCEEIVAEENWGEIEGNVNKGGVKAAGKQRDGGLIAESYISFKKKGWKSSCYFAVLQESEDSAVRYKVAAPDVEDEFFDAPAEAVARFGSLIQ